MGVLFKHNNHHPTLFQFSQTSTGLYRSCAALASFSDTFDLILFESVNFEIIVEKVWLGDVWFE